MHVALIIPTICISCATEKYVTKGELREGAVNENSVCIVAETWDLKGDTISLPKNCTLRFAEGGIIQNGTVIGNNSAIKYDHPFIGSSLSLTGCVVRGKRAIRDKDVFLKVNHTQHEIQTLFNLCDGVKVDFSQGVYENVNRITIESNVDANFNNSTIKLYSTSTHVGDCFYMEPWVDRHLDYVKIKNLRIEGENKGIKGK